ncbi:MAG TPA: cytochrome c [Vicinamibacterales bacterium]|nr:cytochrome c [Vicinamibacterales bacterium]
MQRFTVLLAVATLVTALSMPTSMSGQTTGNNLTNSATVAPVGQEVTFSRNVAPILYANCVYCHRPGEVAPMSLLTYQSARPWARAIKRMVAERRMPPWLADPHFSSFSNDRRLSDTDIHTIVAWVDGGAREGDPADLPKPPQFAEGWQIGVPDLVLTMKEPYKIPAAGAIPWVSLASEDYVFPEDVWVQAIEIRPGNRAVVHHAVAQANLIAPGQAQAQAQGLHLYSPGLDAMIWRDGYGKLIRKGTTISFQMHYNAIGREATDQTKVGFVFAKKPVHTQVNTTIVSNTSIVIPPMVNNFEAVAAYKFTGDARIHALRPHMHLRARTGTASLISENGSRRVLLHIPRWDDSWQNYYVLENPLRVSRGAFLEYVANYDNSPANALNPDPTATVVWGQQVSDEMHSTYMIWTEVNDKNRDDNEPIQISPNKAFTTGLTDSR